MAAHAFPPPSHSPPRHTQHDAYDLISPVSPLMSRSGSVASDGLSMVSGVTAIWPNYLDQVKPLPEYISHWSAAQVVNEAQDAQRGRGRLSDDEDIFSQRNARADVSEGAVATVNAFLDKLLYDILATARSTSLLALRPAVTDVLKKSLARDAIATAEANLEDLLALQDDDSDDSRVTKSPNLSGTKWNLEFIWKRSRLRVMMRSEKSEFDIDDDERYTQEEGLLATGRRFSQTTGVISLSAEIFLAGVLDYLGEQLLSLAATSASNRSRRRASITRATSGANSSADALVEESDVEKAALNSAMDRLWRVWRKSLRARGLIPGRGRSLSGGSRASLNRSNSPTIVRDESAGSIEDANQVPSIPDMHSYRHAFPADIALPMSPRDVNGNGGPSQGRDRDNTAFEKQRTPAQEHNAKAVSDNRSTWTGKVDYFYDPFRVPQDTEQHRPASQPTPMTTPFVDAPGAWPAETPRPVTSDSKEMTQLEKVRRLQEEAVSTSQDDLRTPTVERPVVRASRIPTLDPSQLETDSDDDHSRPSSIIAPNFDESDIKTPPAEKRQGRNLDFGSSISATAIAAAMASIHGSKQPGTLQQPPHEIAEDNDRRKSLGHMKTLISGRDSAQDIHEPESQVTAYPELRRQGSGGSSRTDKSYTLTKPTEVQISSGTRVPQHGSVARNGTFAVEDTAESNPTTPTRDSPSLLRSGIPTPKNAHRPPPLTIASKSINGDDEGPRTAEKNHSNGPRHFLAMRNLSGAHTPTSPTSPRSPRSPRELAKHIRSFSRQSSEGSPEPMQPAPILKQRASGESSRSRKASKAIGMESSSLSRKGSGRTYTNDRIASISMEESGRPGSSKLTSSSITSTEDFDMLVQNHETVKYTLTPQSVRDLPTEASPYNRSIYSSSKSRLEDSSENVASAGSRKPSQATINSNVDNVRVGRAETKSPATSALPKNEQKQPQEQRKVSKERRRSISRPAARNVRSTSSGHLPREPTVQTQSTRDFADFIRSTGPDKEPDTFVPLLASRSSASLRSLAVSQASAQSPAGSIRRPSAVSLSGSRMESENIPPMPAMSDSARKNASTAAGRSPMIGAGQSPSLGSIGYGKSPSLGPGKSPSIGPGKSPSIGYGRSPSIGYGKSPALGPGKSPSIGPGTSPSLGSRNGSLVPREANGSPSIGSGGDLIDFIRSGPEQPGERRIPKTIAPFHGTADHDAMMGASNDSSMAPSRINGSSSFSSVADSRTESMRDSNRDSTNSNSALLPNVGQNWPQTVQPAYPPQPTQASKLNVPGGRSPAFGVERKRHRNKDPYPIDDSEDEDFLTALPRDKRSDSSLVDFLRQNEPPANNAPAPLAVSGTVQARAMMNKARATSVNSLRTATTPKESPPADSKAPVLSSMSPISPMSPTQIPSSGGTRSSYDPSVASVDTSTSNATMRPAHIMSRVSSGENIPQVRRPNANKPKMEVRSAGNTQTARLAALETTSTNDLADFLKSSGPPDESMGGGAPSPVVGLKGSRLDKKKSSGGKFWKKKTYTDLP